MGYRIFILLFTFINFEVCLAVDKEAECALVTGDEAFVIENGQSYIQIGTVTIDTDFDLELEVFPDRRLHDGILLSVGNKDEFNYYEWKTKAVNTVYFVLEFRYSAISVLLKALDTLHMKSVEVFRTYPVAYSIKDAKWHKIRVQRFKNKAEWKLSIDNITVTLPNDKDKNVILHHNNLFLGGRPGYTGPQFNGIIKNLKINGQLVKLGGNPTTHNAQVWHCSAGPIKTYIEETVHDILWEAPRPGMPRPNRPRKKRPNRPHKDYSNQYQAL